MADIILFVTNSGTDKEMILLYLNDFLDNGGNTARDAEFDGLMQRIYELANDSGASSKLADSSMDNIRSNTINDLLTDGIQIIMFTDESQYLQACSMSYCDYFYDANEYLFNPDGNGQNGNSTNSNSNVTVSSGDLDEISEVRAFVIGNIRFGWPSDRLNLIYWKLDIGGQFTEQFIYSGMEEFASGLNNEFNSVINTYPKLWFANVIIVDYFENSAIMEQIIILNTQYQNCRDAKWGNNGTSCPEITDLPSKYSTDGISELCTIDTSLQDASQCERSCGACDAGLLGGNPGDTCEDDGDCNADIYRDIYGYSSFNGICFTRPDEQRYLDNVPQESFCLSVDYQESCANYVAQDKCSSDGETEGPDLSSCDTKCTSNWQCQDGFCNTAYGACS